MEFKDYYRILGVGSDAKPEDIKQSFRRLACLSARRFNADRHANMLISRDYEGSIFDAVQQARRR